MEKTRNTLSIIDIHQAAYLHLQGVEPSLTRQGTRVIFEFPGSQAVLALLKRYNANPPVNVLDFVSHLRRLRSRMLEVRNGDV
jgi:hypothetical protein